MLRKASFLLFEIFVVACLVVISGCAEIRQGNSFDSRNWNVNYTSSVQINTEPSAARIYINDKYIGESPLSTQLTAPVNIQQTGTYPASYTYDWSTGQSTNYYRAGQTTWNSNLSGSFQGGWVIKVYKDGFEPYEYTITQQSLKQFQNAVAMLQVQQGNQLQTSFSAAETEYFLFPLKSAGAAYSPQQQYQQTADNQSNNQSNVLAQARQEYELALQAYENAKREYESTAVGTRLSEEGYNQMHPAAGFLSGLAGDAARNDAKIKLDSARDRLERAKARLDALNYRY